MPSRVIVFDLLKRPQQANVRFRRGFNLDITKASETIHISSCGNCNLFARVNDHWQMCAWVNDSLQVCAGVNGPGQVCAWVKGSGQMCV